MKVTVTILDERLNVKVSTSKIEVPVYHKITNGGTEQIQSDFDQTDDTAVDFIKNKPTLDDTVTDESQNAVKSSGIWAWVKELFIPKDPAETEADTLTDASVFQFWKGELKKITWANIKAALRTYFDTIYSTFSGSYNDLSHKPTIPSNAAQITVSDPVTPDFTPAVQGNNLQQVTNKVAGLQKNLIDLTTTELVSIIDITSDKNGNALNIVEGEIIFVRLTIPYFEYEGLSIDYRADLQLNGQSGANDYSYLGGVDSYNRFFLTGSARPSMTSLIWLYILNNKIHCISKTNWKGTNANDNFYSFTNFTASSITSLRFMALSNRLLGLQTNVYIKKL